MNCVHQLRPPHPPPRGRTEGDAEAVESGGQGSRPAPLRAQRRFLIGNAVTGPRARRDGEAGAQEKRPIDVRSRKCRARAPRCMQDVCRGRMSLLPDVDTFTQPVP